MGLQNYTFPLHKDSAGIYPQTEDFPQRFIGISLNAPIFVSKTKIRRNRFLSYACLLHLTNNYIPMKYLEFAFRTLLVQKSSTMFYRQCWAKWASRLCRVARRHCRLYSKGCIQRGSPQRSSREFSPARNTSGIYLPRSRRQRLE